MLQLLTCSKGHSWEAAAEDGAAVGRAVCPVCGDAVDLLPVFDLAPSPDAITAAPEPLVPQAPPIRDAAGKPVVAGFDILEEVGRSPVGVRLFKAKQVLVNRTVLLKVVVARDDAGQVGWAALRGEAAALGRLSHPNIVPILEAGERERQLFYNAVEWVEGATLAVYAGGRPMRPDQAARLVEVLARAVHAAHEQGVVHRGLRPACIRLQPLPEGAKGQKPEPVEPPFYLAGGKSRCLPKIGDFGLARRPVEGDPADVELFEDAPSYLSPEQAWGRTREIGPSCDIYALGAILYELLSGRPPFRGRTPGETLDFIRGGDPPMLYGRVPGLPNDLAAVCRRAINRSGRGRYQTAREFADDLRASVSLRPVRAWKKGAVGRLILWTRRRPLSALLLLLCVLAPIGVLIAYSVGAGDASTAEARVDYAKAAAATADAQRAGVQSDLAEAKKREQRLAYVQRIFQADREFRAGDTDRQGQLLNACPTELRHWEWQYLNARLAPQDFVTLTGPQQDIAALAYSPDGSLLAAASGPPPIFNTPSDWEVRVWPLRPADGDPVVIGFRDQVRKIAFSPDGKRLATASGSWNDFGAHVGEVKEWDPRHGTLLATWNIPGGTPIDLAYSGDGKRLVVGDAGGRIHAFPVGGKDGLPLIKETTWTNQPRHGGLAQSGGHKGGDRL